MIVRPINLIMQAFGVYKNRVEIPFDKIQGNLYLIAGSTGSGKTTIFDAISYALFNCPSGSLRTNSDLRSHFAKVDVETFVDFTFSIKNDVYRIIRKPSYLRKKQKGEGEILTKPTAELYLPNGTTMSNGVDIDNYIIQLLGINASQFSRIALLAQGEFLKLLNAQTQERGDIFRSIFKTSNYAYFQQKLKDETAKYKDEFDMALSSIIQYLIQLDIDDNDIKNQTDYFINNNVILNFDKYMEDVSNFLETQKQKNETDIQKIRSMEKNIEDKKRCSDKISLKLKLINSKHELIEKIKNQEIVFSDIKKEFEQSDKLKEDAKKLSIDISKLDEDYKKSLEVESLSADLTKNENELESAIKTLDDLVNDYSDLKKAHITNINTEIELNSDLLFKMQSDFEEFQNKLSEKTQSYNIKYNTYLSIQAGVLAKNLKENSPCPVCGSCVHPNPAKLEDENITKETLDVEKSEIDKMNISLSEKSKKCYEVNLNIESLKNKSKKLQNEYSIVVDETYISLKNDDFELLISQKKDEIDKLQDNISSSRILCASLKSKIETLETSFKGKSAKNILIEHEKLTLELDQLNSKIELLAKTYEKENLELQNLISNLELLNSQEAEYENINEGDFDKLNGEILTLSDELKLLNDVLKKADLKYHTNLKILDLIKNKYKDYLKLSQNYLSHKTLCDCANGNLKGKKRLAFEQYIQGYYLDMVLNEANKRFKVMTNGQFELLRKKDYTSLNSKTGLDIEVMDYYTYKTRSTKTLSGGESFKAALCLALGLSDCVSDMSGALNIESMFIDEGFGSLDSESVESAMDVILNLADLNRLIGIISHVEELKSKIQNQIITHKNDSGAYISMVF